MTSSTSTVKRCCTCGHEQPLDQFHRSAKRKDGRDPRCRSCSSVAHRQVPTPPVPGDPVVAIRLREELAAARRAGLTFEDGWPPAVATALDTVSAPKEHQSWERAIAATRGAWEDAYDRHEAQAGHQAVAMLAAAA